MSFLGDIGEITEDGGGFSSFGWRIPDFPSLSHAAGDRYESPFFESCGGVWYFEMYSGGLYSREERPGWLHVSLVRCDGGPPQALSVTLGIRGPKGVENKKERRQVFSEGDDACCWRRFCSRQELTSGRESRLSPGNVLTLTCDISVVPVVTRGSSNDAEGNNEGEYGGADDEKEEEENDDKTLRSRINAKQQNQVTNAKKRTDTLVKDLGKLLSSGQDSDVTVLVGDVELQAHRAILSVRSPVLSAMFKHETAEKAANKISVCDCDPEVFREYLKYIYTGSVELLSEENVFHLYRVADKYLAEELKEQCLVHVRETLGVQTFCDAVKLALTYGESSLLQQTIDFATENIRSIICTVEWQNFIREYPTEANEVLIKSLGPASASQKSKR